MSASRYSMFVLTSNQEECRARNLDVRTLQDVAFDHDIKAVDLMAMPGRRQWRVYLTGEIGLDEALSQAKSDFDQERPLHALYAKNRARYLAQNEETVRRYARSGKLAYAGQVAGEWRFHEADLRALVKPVKQSRRSSNQDVKPLRSRVDMAWARRERFGEG